MEKSARFRADWFKLLWFVGCQVWLGMVCLMIKLGLFKKVKFQESEKFEFQRLIATFSRKSRVEKVGRIGSDLWTVTKYSRSNSEVTCDDNSQSIVLEFVQFLNSEEILNLIQLNSMSEKNDIRLVVSRYRVTFVELLEFWMNDFSRRICGWNSLRCLN